MSSTIRSRIQRFHMRSHLADFAPPSPSFRHTLTCAATPSHSRTRDSPPNMAAKHDRYMKLAPRPRHMPVIPCAA